MGVVWFFCLGGLGSFFPYFSLYLHENAGLDGAQVGRVLAILPLVGILAQPLWGQLADRTGSRSRVLALLALGAGLGYAALALPRGFAAIALATAGLAIFAMPLIPSCVSVTLALVRDSGPHAFGLARVWGTVGFLLVVVGFPFLLDAWQSWRGLAVPAGGPEPGMKLMFPLTGALVAVAGLVALRLPGAGAVALRAPRGDWRRLLRHGPYLRVLLFVMAAYTCVQGPMLLFPVFVRSHGGSPDARACWRAACAGRCAASPRTCAGSTRCRCCTGWWWRGWCWAAPSTRRQWSPSASAPPARACSPCSA
jgi:MFS family permease